MDQNFTYDMMFSLSLELLEERPVSCNEIACCGPIWTIVTFVSVNKLSPIRSKYRHDRYHEAGLATPNFLPVNRAAVAVHVDLLFRSVLSIDPINEEERNRYWSWKMIGQTNMPWPLEPEILSFLRYLYQPCSVENCRQCLRLSQCPHVNIEFRYFFRLLSASKLLPLIARSPVVVSDTNQTRAIPEHESLIENNNHRQFNSWKFNYWRQAGPHRHLVCPIVALSSRNPRYIHRVLTLQIHLEWIMSLTGEREKKKLVSVWHNKSSSLWTHHSGTSGQVSSNC